MSVTFGNYLSVNKLNSRNEGSGVLFHFSLFIYGCIGGFHVTSSPPCWWTVNKRSLFSSLCLSTGICSFHHCYLCLPRIHENHLFALQLVVQATDFESGK